jgi:hypothetical protein
VDLTAKERAFLKDPDWIDEDESDCLLAMRRIAEHEGQAIPFEEVLREFGYEELDGRLSPRGRKLSQFGCNGVPSGSAKIRSR